MADQSERIGHGAKLRQDFSVETKTGAVIYKGWVQSGSPPPSANASKGGHDGKAGGKHGAAGRGRV